MTLNKGAVTSCAAAKEEITITATLTTLLSFNGSNGLEPSASLLLDANGDLFGTTYGGVGYGNVFELVNNGGTYTPITLLSFDGSNGANPSAGLIADAKGNLFGTTAGGGANGDGTVFELVNNGGTYTFTMLFSATLTYGADLSGGLIADANGDLFGSGVQGGAIGAGTVLAVPIPPPLWSTLMAATEPGRSPA